MENTEIKSYLVILCAKNEKGEEIGMIGIADIMPCKGLTQAQELVTENADTASSNYIS
jgi:hypothetical protein